MKIEAVAAGLQRIALMPMDVLNVYVAGYVLHNRSPITMVGGLRERPG